MMVMLVFYPFITDIIVGILNHPGKDSKAKSLLGQVKNYSYVP